jgi:hypothetical protein
MTWQILSMSVRIKYLPNKIYNHTCHWFLDECPVIMLLVMRQCTSKQSEMISLGYSKRGREIHLKQYTLPIVMPAALHNGKHMQNTANCVDKCQLHFVLRHYFCLCIHPAQILTMCVFEIIIIIITIIIIIIIIQFNSLLFTCHVSYEANYRQHSVDAGNYIWTNTT